ncbi:NAD dependent epimerase/dehydratase family protein-like protein [Lindgomyces ingoldianus]|uniref:NAD dependent epimerase/dehydratase family protein-like protein n=1 Tax=Lindgomyces ingoldianus TaxID=673940 RepID=A0ACB6QHI7_9PLEO|nr:NAD dependent epimerase/dehydratase family protein-like protein [Lindgomyces ingoldianus]KAF2465577.1 NAD dependent epimerase/dehydratase family protein-like protein [Lindgomyces ingoldianus]
MSNQQLVESRGIYHGLPVYPSALKGFTAIITGANGISGYYMLRVLAQDPERWTKIYCLSRRPPAIPSGLPKNAEHIALDFLQSPSEIAAILKEKGVTADYVFFYSYIQVPPKEGMGLWSNASEMCRVNLSLLQNFLEALPQASITPKRIMLQTGAKNYGIHLGPAATPQEETAPRVTLEPNFYYPQEDFLWKFCAEHNIGWNVCMPSFILGAVPDAAMNLVFPLGVFAAVHAHLAIPLDFPADLQSWEATHVGSSSMLNGYLEEWAVLTDGARNQKLNAADSSPFTWGNFWPKFAGWYGVQWSGPDMDEGVYTKVTSRFDPPPRGYAFGPPKTFRIKYTLTKWARQHSVQKAWSELIQKHNLQASKLEDMDIDRIFSFTDSSLIGGTLDLSMNKARKMGWHGFVDTNDCIKEVLEEFSDLKLLPPLPT